MSQARLLVTAACLHLHADIGPAPSLADLKALLVTLGAGPSGWSALAKSPIQFVRYVAAELADGENGFGLAIDLAVGAVATAKL